MHITHLLPLALAVMTATAYPLLHVRDDDASLAAKILKAAPGTESCSTASFPDECATAAEAAPHIAAAMERFCIHETPVVAALVDIMLFESGAFQFNRNHFPEPGRPGQGTRNMQMSPFNHKYALDVPELRDQAVAIAGDTADDALSDDQKNDILALVMPDEYSFASAAWYLTTQCEASVRKSLADNGDEGFKAYLADCVGVEAGEERLEHWKSTKAAFGL